MDPAAFLATQHDPSFVAASLLVATFAAYVSLDLARRVRQGPEVRWLWWLGGSIAMGTGIWSMHFIGMLGFDPGIPLVYSTPTTLLSWLAAVAAAGVALGVAMREKLSVMTALLGSSSMALGICAMHYLGMSALDLSLGIVWRVPVVLASVAVAWAASSAALLIFFGLRGQSGRRRFFLQAVSALVMGCAIGGMHYTGMAAALIPAGSVCITASGLSGQPLALLVAGATVLLLGVALLLSLIDAVAHARESRLADSLHQANTELQVANDELLRMAFADPLTGLRNRSFFDAQLRRTVATATMDKVAVVFVDLDGFKPINDSFGHETGDIVLREVAVRLGQCVRNGGTLARLGGDEFVVMLTAADARGAALAVSERMITALRRPVAVVGQELGISCSVGIAIFPDHDRTGSRLVACADAAMYAAKRLGGTTCVLYEPGMGADSTERVILHQALRNAIAQNELELYYQPKISAQDGHIHGFEALLRWNHPQNGLTGPGVFIPLAERFGLIGTIGAWVIEQACAQLGQWKREGVDCRVAINLSPHQLRNPRLPQLIEAALRKNHIEPSRLVCEITETALMENVDSESEVMKQIAALGVRLSIDDFGTGYSSLAHLRRVPAKQLKIDRSFVADLEEVSEGRAVVNAIVQLAHALSIEVVAEGVETHEQLRTLRELGCDVLQGYAIARPMPAGAVARWLAAEKLTRDERLQPGTAFAPV